MRSDQPRFTRSRTNRSRAAGPRATRSRSTESRGPGRLRRADCSGPGIQRRRRGRGFSYLTEEGEPVTDPQVLARIKALAIPPAWTDVWVCPDPAGHIQATGVDAAGRKQYLYHEHWRLRRDRQKFDDMLDFARALPDLRTKIASDLELGDLSREQVLACAVRLLDRGFFRIGGEGYAARNDSYGLATIRKSHVRLRGDTILFDYPAKGGKRRLQAVIDSQAAWVVSRLLRRRSGGPQLLACRGARGWVKVRSDDINEYLKTTTGREFSAKDFRTWNATVLAAVALAVSGAAADSRHAREGAIRRAVGEVAHYLGNTAAVARSSYIDPRVFDRFRDGLTIGGIIPEVGSDTEQPAIQGAVEEAVIDLLAGHETAVIEQVT